MTRLILALILLGATMWFLSRIGRLEAEERARFIRSGALWGAAGLILVLVVTGRVPVIFAAIAGALPWIQRISMLKTVYDKVRAMAGLSDAGPSTIETRYLRVQLDPRSGKLTGTVMDGPQIGRLLDDMERHELITLLREVEINDIDSSRLLESYMASRFPDWSEPGNGTRNAVTPGGDLSRDEAFAILGLPTTADESEILDAHRRLIQKLHPDRGGADWLASKINQAKDRLMSDQREV